MFVNSAPLRRILIVSRTFPLDFEHAKHGIFQRLQVLLRAASLASESIDALFFVSAASLPGIDVARYETQFRECWGVALRLHLAPLSECAQSWSRFYLRPVFGIEYHEDYLPTSTATQARAVFEAIAEDTDIVLAHRLHAALPVHAAKKLGAMPPVVVDVDDIEHRKFLRELRQPPYWAGKILKFLHVPAIAVAERRMVRAAAVSFVCSESDRRYVQRLAWCKRVAVVPNSVDLGQISSGKRAIPATRRIVFVGTYSHRPNVDAAEHLLHEVFPRIRAKVPDAELELVGPGIESLPSYGQRMPGVNFRGFVLDLAEVWAEARLLCCPIRAGGGTRIKIIEAAARGVPVVSTTMGAEGLDFEDGREILLGDSPADLADACARVLQDDALAFRLATAAQKNAVRYDRETVTRTVAELLLRTARVNVGRLR